MADKTEHMFLCRSCGATELRNQHGGVMCEKCGVFMTQTNISASTFEEMDVETEENYG